MTGPVSSAPALPCRIAGEPRLPLLATAIHAGHAVRPEIAARLALTADERRREEDPFTDRWTAVAPLRIVGTVSRFEVDLNRPRAEAVYRVPDDAWGLTVWRDALPDAVVGRSLERYDAFHDAAGAVLDDLHARFGTYAVLDLHSYNHRRGGADVAPAAAGENPEVNIGTSTLDLRRVGRALDRFAEALRAGRGAEPLDVRTNVKFRGGHFAQWINARHPGAACAIAIEFKKVFMDEWTGVPDENAISRIGACLTGAVPVLLAELGALGG